MSNLVIRKFVATQALPTNTFTVQELTLGLNVLNYTKYSKSKYLKDGLREYIARNMLNTVLDTMKYDIVEEYDGKYAHRFSMYFLVDKERLDYENKISKLEEQIKECSKIITSNSKVMGEYKREIEIIKNYSFWDRLKFLFRGYK